MHTILLEIELDRCIVTAIYISAVMTSCRCIVSAKFCRYIFAIFAYKSVTLLLCMECSETQVATLSLTLFD